MTDAEKLALIQQAYDNHVQNAEDDEGNKWLSSSGYFSEAVGAILYSDDLARYEREGWFTLPK